MATLQTTFAKTRANSLIARLLYGANVDRNAKARARVGLAILAFVLVYAAIAAKLIYFGVMSDGSANKRFTPQDAVATARPDIVDRNGEILATDVRTPSLFAEPRKIIDVDEAVELLTATLPDLDANELRERLSSKRGFIWLKREITPKQQKDVYRMGVISRLSQTKPRLEPSRSRSSPESRSGSTAVSSSVASSTSIMRRGSANSDGVRTSVARISPLRSRMSGRAVATASWAMARRDPCPSGAAANITSRAAITA